MRVEIKWLEGVRKRPVPVRYACTMSFTNPPEQMFSVILTFPQQTRIWAELELLVVKDLIIGNGVFYITEGGRVVAEAWIRQTELTLVRSNKKDGVHYFQVFENNRWIDTAACPSSLSLFHKTEAEYAN